MKVVDLYFNCVNIVFIKMLMLKAYKVGHIDVEISEEDKVVWLTTGKDHYEISVVGVYYVDEAKDLIKVLSEYIELCES